MRTLSLLIVVIVLTLVSVTWAADHVMVEPKDLKWEDVSVLPPGAKVAVIEGPLDQATPFISDLSSPLISKSPRIGIRLLSKLVASFKECTRFSPWSWRNPTAAYERSTIRKMHGTPW
jgi:hypothetical protein